MNFSLRALAGLSVWSLAMAYGASTMAQTNPPTTPSPYYQPKPAPSYQQQPARGYQQPAPSYQQQPAPSYQQQPAPGYQQQPAPGYQQQPAPGYQQQPAPGYQQPSYQQRPAPGYQQQPAPGYQQQPSYQQQPAPGYQQQPSYQQQPAPAYQQQPAPSYQQQPAPGYQQQPAPAYQQQPTPGYQQQGYQPPVAQPTTSNPPTSSWSSAPVYSAPQSKPADTREGYKTAYGHLGLLLGPHGWSQRSDGSVPYGEYNWSGKFTVGFLLAGYVPLSNLFQVGGYLRFESGDVARWGAKYNQHQYSFGGSAKVGTRIDDRIWVGGVGDLGLYVQSPEGGNNWYGFLFSPRVHIDVHAISVDKIRLGGFASFGPTIVPYALMSADDYNGDSQTYTQWLFYLTFIVGVTGGF